MSFLKELGRKFQTRNDDEETLQEKIIEVHKKLRRLRNRVKKTNNTSELKELYAEINVLSKEKKNKESQLIKMVAKDFCYFGVGVDLSDVKKGPQVILLPWGDVQNHLLNIGTTRVGKTKFMLSNIRQNIMKGDNVIVIDPKGGIDHEILGSLVYFGEESKRLKDIMYVNPALPDNSVCFNPLYGMEDDEITSLITTLIYPTTTPENEFYARYIQSVLKQILSALTFQDMCLDRDKKIREKAERKEMLKFVLKYMKKDLEKLKEKKEIEKHNRLAKIYNKTHQDFTKLIEELKNSGYERTPRSLITFRELSYYLVGENLEKLREDIKTYSTKKEDGTIDRELERKKQEITHLLEGTKEVNKEFHGKIAMSLINWINAFSTGTLGELFCSIRINPLVQKLHDKDSGLILLVHPLPLMFKKLSEDINKMIMKMLETCYGLVSLSGRALGNKRTYIHLDEGESSMYIGIESVLNKLAGLGATANIYTQSFADFDSRLGEIVSRVSKDSLNTYLIMRVNDPESVDKVIALMGTTTYTKANFIQNSEGISASYTNETRNLLTHQDVIKLDVGTAYLRNRGRVIKLVFPEMTDDLMRKISLKKQDVEKRIDKLIETEKMVKTALIQAENMSNNKPAEVENKIEKELMETERRMSQAVEEISRIDTSNVNVEAFMQKTAG